MYIYICVLFSILLVHFILLYRYVRKMRHCHILRQLTHGQSRTTRLSSVGLSAHYDLQLFTAVICMGILDLLIIFVFIVSLQLIFNSFIKCVYISYSFKLYRILFFCISFTFFFLFVQEVYLPLFSPIV